MKSARKPSEAGQETPSKRKHNDETLFDGAPPLHLLLPSAPRTHPRPSCARLPHCASRELEADLQTTRSRPPLHQPASRRGGTPRQEARAPTAAATAQPSEPFLFPKLRNQFVDFPHLHYFIDQSFFNLKTCCGLRYDMQRYAALRRLAFQGPGV